MKPASQTLPGGRAPDAGEPVDTKDRKTPAADMQGDDSGTADSGNETAPANQTPAESAMKQTSKTDAERGDKR